VYVRPKTSCKKKQKVSVHLRGVEHNPKPKKNQKTKPQQSSGENEKWDALQGGGGLLAIV